MYFDGEHFCKGPDPFDATTFDLIADPLKSSFSGIFKITFDHGHEKKKKSFASIPINIPPLANAENEVRIYY